MTQLDAVNYKNGQKNNWRARAWNEIRSRTQNTRDAVVLYLPGSMDLDRKVAISKGFHGPNLIAVERDSEVATVLRGRGVTTIPLSLEQAVTNWPDKVHVDVLIADFQCGLTDAVKAVLSCWLARSAFRGSILVNMQRGREQGHEASLIKLRQEAMGLLKELPSGANVRKFEEEFGLRNRGMMAVEHVAQIAMAAGEKFGCKLSKPADFAKCFGVKILHSYRSSDNGVLMDSVIIQKRRRIGATIDELNGMYSVSADEIAREAAASLAMRRVISAALAVRTMRLNGDLRGVA
jgi:hypothetical protein